MITAFILQNPSTQKYHLENVAHQTLDVMSAETNTVTQREAILRQRTAF